MRLHTRHRAPVGFPDPRSGAPRCLMFLFLFLAPGTLWAGRMRRRGAAGPACPRRPAPVTFRNAAMAPVLKGGLMQSKLAL